MDKNKGKKDALKPSDKGYKIVAPTTRELELERQVRSLLNKICPDNLKVIVERLAHIDLHKADELEFVIRIIFGKALLEPHYCETYADMVFALRSRYPEFPPEAEGEKAHTFTRVLLNTCQNEFESLPTTFEPTEEDKQKLAEQELRLELKRRKDKMLANMKFIGNLFLRQLLAVKVIGQVVHDLIGIKDSGQGPEEHMIECVCELLQAIGYTLDGTQHGKALMSQFSARLVDLKRTLVDGKQAFGQRIQFKIQDLLDLRSNSWQKKLFKEQAKTREEVRRDALKESKQAAKGVDVTFSVQTAGLRPTYIEDVIKQPPKRPKAPEPRDVKPTWELPFVKRVFQYYIEDKNAENLVSEWKKPEPTTENKKDGIGWLAQIGFEDVQKEDNVAETICELLQRRAIDWNILQDALSPHMDVLDDMRMDVPQAPKFAESLFSRLLLSFGKSFQSSLLKVFTAEQNQDLVYTVLIGVLRKIHNKGGSEGVRKVVNDHPELVNKLCQAKGLKKDQLSSALAKENLGHHTLS